MHLHPILFKTWRKRGGGRHVVDLARFMLMSPRALARPKPLKVDHVKVRALAAWGMHLDFAPDISGGAVFPYLEGMANQAFGMVLGKGGADTIIKAMIKADRGSRRQGELQRRGDSCRSVTGRRSRHWYDGRPMDVSLAPPRP